jgi:hypothetical protein
MDNTPQRAPGIGPSARAIKGQRVDSPSKPGITCRVSLWWRVPLGSHFAQDQQSSDTAVGLGIACTAITCGIIGFLSLYACFEIRALQKAVSPDSSTGKALKKIYPILVVLGILSLNSCLSSSLIPVVPWLRDRTGKGPLKKKKKKHPQSRSVALRGIAIFWPIL